MEEYLTTKQLGERIKMSPGTIRNLVWKNAFKVNVHYLRPTPRKLIFVWSEVRSWLYENSIKERDKNAVHVDSLINI